MTREEAIEVVKERLDYYEREKRLKKACEILIPELAESEDERIRKHLIEIVEIYWGTTNEPGKAADLAWLEKQKEQKHPNGCFTCDEYKKGYEEGRRNGFTAGYNKAMKEVEQKEQKPVEINEYEIIKKHITEDVLSSEVNKRLKECEWYVTDEKPAEWNEDCNEEDIQTRFAFYTYKDDPCTLYLSNVFVEETSRNKGFGTKILAAAEKVAETFGVTYIRLKVKQNYPANAWYRKNGYGYVAFEDGYDWLEKNLEYMKSQPKQEWSKEDERKYQCIRNILLTDMDKKVGSWKYSEILEWYEKRGIGRYTNSKLHWKPSKEQMEALERTIHLANFGLEVDRKKALESLYEQIKKL